MTLKQVGPAELLPHSTALVLGVNLGATARHVLRLRGVVTRGGVEAPSDLSFPLRVKEQHGEFSVEGDAFATLEEGQFAGSAEVTSTNAWGSVTSAALPVALRFLRYLAPALDAVAGGMIFLNAPVNTVGAGILMGGGEGRTFVELKGCFLSEGVQGDCATVGRSTEAKVLVEPERAIDRRQGSFLFGPEIAGLRPAHFEGTVVPVNVHADGKVLKGPARTVQFDLQRSKLGRFDQSVVSLGQYLDLRGAGFVGGPNGGTAVQFRGTFTPEGQAPRPVTFSLVPEVRSGAWMRYVVEEKEGLGEGVAVRLERGLYQGRWTPTVYHGGDSYVGAEAQLALRLDPVKQVCWVRFADGWVESLRLFGLQAADARLRERVFEVMRRDYGGLNVEFRDQEPTDFRLYARVDITGKDPNALGLLGYDNTPGKDVENRRLEDRIGGVNAQTQQDGFPGYGGIFAESMLGFSTHPPPGLTASPLASPVFDRLFDVFRPDVGGSELTSGETLGTPRLPDARGCPAQGRPLQAACAIHVLGNLIGSTASHELGHSFGLADPYGASDTFHNPGDLPNRLMDAGGARPFDERAELDGKGPAMFCADEFQYLRKLLPLAGAKDPAGARPSCN